MESLMHMGESFNDAAICFFRKIAAAGGILLKVDDR
jgi:hypothetical protein